MKNEFCTYEQALALKELEFDEPCIGYYYNEKIYFDSPGVNLTGPSGEQPLPLKQQAFRWFREKHELFVLIGVRSVTPFKFYYSITDIRGNEIDCNLSYINTYEEAEQACLDKLIEITKTKNKQD